ncbi:MAG: hypothetical protein ABI132_07330 [Rhodanobacteraceae bacterium]
MKTLLALVATLALSACVTVGTKLDDSKLSQLVRGSTTVAQAEALLGAPVSVSQDGTTGTVLGYSYVNAHPTGPFSTASTVQIVTLRFGTDGKLIDYSTTNGQSKGSAY